MTNKSWSQKQAGTSEGPRVSVIVPAYNQARYLAQSIESVLRQIYQNYEVLVVDDGSTDDTPLVAREFGERIRYLHQANRGLAGARNTGIRAARGELVALLDADDIWLPNFLDTMVAMVDCHPEASVFYSQARCIDVQGFELPQILGGPPLPAEELYWTLLRANFLIPSTIVMHREFIWTAGMFDERQRFCEDWELWLRTLPQQRFVGTSACLAGYRLHSSSLSSNTSGVQRAHRSMVEKLFGPDDGQYQAWSPEKRRAFGGLYRYHVLSSVQRQDDWQAGARYLRLALLADPSLALDLNLFYELAWGGQSIGYRSTSQELDLDKTARQIDRMLADAFGAQDGVSIDSLSRQTYGTAYHALGLVAYIVNQRSRSRGFLLKALWFRPDLWQNRTIAGTVLKSLASRSTIDMMRHMRNRLYHPALSMESRR